MNKIASSFRRRLRRHLGARKYRAVLVANALEKDPRIDHAHDFVDANDIWADAFKSVKGRPFNFTPSDFKTLNLAIRAFRGRPRRRR